MSPLFYIIRKQLKNIIRGLGRKPLALIGYILIGILMVGFILFALVMPSGSLRHGSNELFKAIFTALIIVCLYFSLRQGIEKGSSYFRFSDVNLVFTAPVRQNKVLLYGFIKHMGTSFLIVLFMIFQIPNIKNNFMLTGYGVWIILLTALLYSLLNPIIGMVMYIYTSKSKAVRIMAKRIIDALMALAVLGLFINIITAGDFLNSAVRYLNSAIFSWLPLIGQLVTIASAAVYGITPVFFLSIAILFFIIAVFLFILYKNNLDYYEDVLAATEYTELKIKAKRKGRDVSAMGKKNVRNIRSKFSVNGAAAIFQKQMLEYRKASYFLFFDKSSIIIILAGIIFRLFMPELSEFKIFAVLFFSAYMLFFFVIQGKWPQEIEKPYIFLIPEPDGKKLLYTTLTENIKNFLDGILLFAIFYIFFEKNIVVIFLCIISYTLYGSVYIYGDIVSRRLFGAVHSKAMQIFIKLFVSFFVLIPGVIIGLLAFSLLESKEAAFMIITLWNLTAAALLFLASKGVFKHIEQE
jgi:hypothetical protein